MNKFVKIALIMLGIVVLIGGFIYYKMFYLGTSDYSSIVIEKTTLGNNELVITGDFSDSSRAYKDFSYTLVGKELYVTVNSVLVSNKYKSGNFKITIPLGSSSVDNIHLTDNKSTKVIYKK